MLYQNKIVPELKKKFLKLIGNYRKIEYQKALKFLKECDSILDVGCGRGRFLELLNKNKKKEIVGIDLNPDLIKICLEKRLDVHFGDALNIPFEESRFDGVYCSHLMHVFAPSQAFTLLKELIRVVKPNGIIAITTVPMYSRLFSIPQT